MFKEQTKIFDAINIVAGLFRGSVFFSNSEIHFLDDRPRIPIALFTNANVKNGEFNYINNRRDQQFNTVEVAYLDRFDNYQTKIEYIQDESDIRKRGVFKTDINTLGVTSRAMARRIGQHLIFQTIKENQSLEFTAGLDSLLCRPGDLVIVEDEMKTLSSNYGRILEINPTEKSLYIDNFFETGSFTGKITVYTPTGFSTSNELEALAESYRNRVPYFDVDSNLIDSSDSILTGRYSFSGYVEGYSDTSDLPTQFPIYTGLNNTNKKLFCYYNTGFSGFVFATGLPFTDNNLYDKVITSIGITDISYFETGSAATGFRYSSASPTKRTSPSGNISASIDTPFNSYRGILENEISTVNNSQITTFNITGWNTGLDYGSKVFIDQNDINANLLPLIGQGGVYRIERKNASDQIYKIISIREQNQNEYSISASKYDTGKFQQIEKHITSDYLPETYSSTPLSLYKQSIEQLASPEITKFTTGTTGSVFSLTGEWNSVPNATGYSWTVYNQNNSFFITETTPETSLEVTGLNIMGQWELNLQALGNNSTYINSEIATTGAFVAYYNTTSTPLDRSAIVNVIIN
jgi:hypothetical protein